MALSRNVDECLRVAREIEPACNRQMLLVHLQLIFLPDKPARFFEQMAGKLNIMLRSIYVSLVQRNFEVRVWTNDPSRVKQLLDTEIVKRIRIQQWDATKESTNTPFAQLSEKYLNLNDKLNYRGGDLLRLIILYNYGGLYMDIDSLMLRDVSPLTAADFVTHWECIDGKLNGAMMYAAHPQSKFITKLAGSIFCSQISFSALLIVS